MRNDEINKNEISTEEVFAEQELSELNETLKNSENIEIPESLSKENVKEMLKKEVNKLEILENLLFFSEKLIYKESYIFFEVLLCINLNLLFLLLKKNA